MFKSKVKLLAVMACCSVLLLCSTMVFALGIQNFGGNVNIEYKALTDIWNVTNKTFNKNILNKLLQQISNDATSSTTNMSKVNSLATTQTSAGDMRNFSVCKESGDDVTVGLGGLKWTVAYLSRAKGTSGNNGDVILTLWLDNCVQNAWKDKNISTTNYGFVNGGLYGVIGHGKSDNPTDEYPNNMYGSSEVRADTLNNGGLAVYSNTTTKTYNQNSDSVFSLFTMDDGGLTKYIVKPKDVQWQEYGQNAKSRAIESYSLPNENWSENIPNDNTYMDETYLFGYDSRIPRYYNYADKKNNSVWKDDCIWLPSLTETGASDLKTGLWELSVSQRSNANGSTSAVGKIGSNNVYNYSWLRSGHYYNAYYSYCIHPSGSGSSGDSNSVFSFNAIRPALHLNLTKAAAAAV